jgi:hypothetical protein
MLFFDPHFLIKDKVKVEVKDTQLCDFAAKDGLKGFLPKFAATKPSVLNGYRY